MEVASSIMGKAEKQRKLSDAVSKIKERKKPQKGLVATMKRLINTVSSQYTARPRLFLTSVCVLRVCVFSLKPLLLQA